MAALLKSPWKKADVPSSWHLYFYFVQRWIWLSCLLLFPAFGMCCSALLKMCLLDAKLPASLNPRGTAEVKGSCLLCGFVIHFSSAALCFPLPLPLQFFDIFFSLFIQSSLGKQGARVW